jgi:hypothetical protein
MQESEIHFYQVNIVWYSKCVTWPKTSGKGRQEWSNACTDVEFQSRKLNTPVKTK